MSVDHSIDYSFAGKGAKARNRKGLNSEKPEQSAQSPIAESRAKQRDEPSEPMKQTARGVKARIGHLVIDHDATFAEAVETMRGEGYSVTAITISAIRMHTKETIRLLLDIGLLDEETLEQHRRKIKKQALAASKTDANFGATRASLRHERKSKRSI